MNAYNPSVDLDPQAWLASDEESRINVVFRYHQRHGLQGPSGRAHSIVHVVVENQLAMNEPGNIERGIELNAEDPRHASTKI